MGRKNQIKQIKQILSFVEWPHLFLCRMATFVLIMNAVFLNLNEKDVSCIFYDSAMAPKVLLNKYFCKQWRPWWNAA